MIELVTRAGLRELRPGVDVLVVDEVHDDLQAVESFLADSKPVLLGISATPIRDRNAGSEGTARLRQLFGPPLPVERDGSTPRQDANQLLREVRYHRLETIPAETGLLPRANIRDLAKKLSELAREEQSLVFAHDRYEAAVLRWCLAARLLGAERIAVVDESTPRGARTELFHRFEHGDLQHLINVEVLATGFNAPQVRNVFIARATRSPALYFQMVGRGRRPGPGDCQVFDVNFDRRDKLLSQLEFHRDAEDST